MNKSGSLLNIIIVLATLGVSTVAAADESGWYGRLNGGFTSLSDSDISVSGQAAAGAEFDGGALFGGAIGRQFGPIRVEGEIAYRSNDISTHGLSGYSLSPEAGDFASLGVGLNILYEANLFGGDKAVSYFGAGLVYIEEIDIDLISSANEEVSFADSDFGFQLIAGARYKLSDRWDAFAEFRYFDGGSVTLDSESGTGVSIDADYASTEMIFGIGYRF